MSVDNHFTRQYIPEDNSEHKAWDGQGMQHIWRDEKRIGFLRESLEERETRKT
jgi:hypothetical protein